MIKATLKEKNVYTLCLPNGLQIHDMEIVSRWEFFVKLKGRDGVIIAMSEMPDTLAFSKMFPFFSDRENSDEQLVIISGSPSLVNMMTESK